MKSKSRSPFLYFPASALAAVLLILLTNVCSEAQQTDAAASPDVSGSKYPADRNNTRIADPNPPVAKVNGVTIYQSELSCAVEASVARNMSEFRNLSSVSSGKTLNKLVDIELLYQESLKHRFRGLIEESDQRYQTEVKRLGGEDKLAAALQCNNISPEQFRKTIFRNLSIKHLLNKLVYSKVQVTEDEIREYYDLNKERLRHPGTIRLSQILVKAPSELGEKKWRHAEDQALRIYRDAVTGTDFVRLVRKYSDDPASANTGGDMGPIQKGSIQGILDTTIFSLEAGSVAKPIRSRRGFHIFKVTSTTSPSIKTLEEVRQYITTRLRRERSREMISRLLSDLRTSAEIVILN